MDSKYQGSSNQLMSPQPMVMPNQPMVLQNQMTQPMQPMQPMQAMQAMLPMHPIQPYIAVPAQLIFVNDPLGELMISKQAVVKQKIELFEIATGCETPNQYYVYTEDEEKNKKYLFKAKEHSSCCCRFWCDGNRRGFDLDFKKIMYTAQGHEKKVDFAKYKRPCKCTTCCFCRPEMSGNFVGDKTDYVGKVTEPCTVCDPKIHLWNPNNVIEYTISCNCCQCGYVCRERCCGKCYEVDFSIYEGSSITGKPVGKIHKKFRSCGRLIADSDADTFRITFPEAANAEMRFLIVSATVMLDYLYYEDKNAGKVS